MDFLHMPLPKKEKKHLDSMEVDEKILQMLDTK